MLAHLLDGAKKGFLLGLIYAWADTMVVYVVTRVMTGTVWNPFTTTTLHMAGLMVLLSTAVGALVGLVLGKFLEKRSWTWSFQAICAGLAVVAFFGSPEVDRILGLALLGVGVAAGTSALLVALARRNRLLLAGALPLMAVVWYAAVSRGLVTGTAQVQDPNRPRPADAAPNILWVVYDTTTADHVSLYGYPRKTTPNLDALASSGVAFDKAYSTAPWTLPSHAAMFTGTFSSRHGCQDEHTYLDAVHTTVAQVLSEAGYDTAIFAGNPWLDHQTGVTRGFSLVHPSWRDYSLGNLFVVGRLEVMFFTGGQDKGAAESTHAFKEWLRAQNGDRKNGGRPFFAFVNYMEAHAPYHQIPYADQERYLPKGVTRKEADAVARRYMSRMMFSNDYHATPEDKEIAIAQYDGGIHNADAGLGRLVDLLKENGRLENTLIIVNGDHGELFGEHDIYSHDLVLYHPLVHVPLVMHYPGRVPSGVHIDKPVQLIDIFPTILELAGLKAKLPSEVQGTSVIPLFSAGGDPNRPLYAEQFAPHLLPLIAEIKKLGLDPAKYGMKSVQVGSLRLMVRSPDHREELFDVSSDPGEEHNLLTTRPDEANRLRGLLDQFSKGTQEAVKGGAIPAMDAATREKLKSLGYVQ